MGALKDSTNKGKSILQVPDTGTWVLGNTTPFLHSSIVSSWITPARSKEREYHTFRQYWYTRNVPVFTNTGMFQYLGPEVYFFPNKWYRCTVYCYPIELANDFDLIFPTTARPTNYAFYQTLPDLYAFTLAFWMRTTDKSNLGTPVSYANVDNDGRFVDNMLTLHDYNNFILFVNGESVLTDMTANE